MENNYYYHRHRRRRFHIAPLMSQTEFQSRAIHQLLIKPLKQCRFELKRALNEYNTGRAPSSRKSYDGKYFVFALKSNNKRRYAMVNVTNCVLSRSNTRDRQILTVSVAVIVFQK